MKVNIAFRSNYAVSEIVGGMLLILVAVLAFCVIYVYLSPPDPDYEPSVKIEGMINDDGDVMLEHVSGGTIEHYKIIVNNANGTSIGSKSGYNWRFSEYRYPLEDITDIRLIDDSVSLDITVYSIYKNGDQKEIFSWQASGRTTVTPPPELEDPMLISSLRTDTTDEDLICYNYTIISEINPSTYIYNWTINGVSITDILAPFDNNSLTTVKDYSGNENHGTLSGPTWVSNGVVGGAYQFDGIDNYISLPYCYDGSYIDAITVEMWIKTDSDDMILASYNQDEYWEIAIVDGVIQWTTTANGETYNLYGDITVNDNNWHHVAVTYNSNFGDCSIFIDGEHDKTENCHNTGEELGSGSTPGGFIGTGNTGISQSGWELLTYDDFEDGFGNYTDGGRDCILYTEGTYAHQGSNSALIQDNSGWESSFYHTSYIDVDTPSYTSIKVDFWWMRCGDYWGNEYGEDWWVRYFDGSDWNTVLDVNYPGGYSQDTWYHQIIYINETDYNFPSNMKIRFQCDASSDYDKVYIDQVYVTAKGEVTISNYSGLVDEFRIYNRELSGDQIFQNYLCSRDGATDKRVIVSDETMLGQTWQCTVTPNNGNQDDEAVESNTLQIIGYGG